MINFFSNYFSLFDSNSSTCVINKHLFVLKQNHVVFTFDCFLINILNFICCQSQRTHGFVRFSLLRQLNLLIQNTQDAVGILKIRWEAADKNKF